MLRRILKQTVDFQRRDSPARRYRERRQRLFRSLLDRVPRPLSILDVGGTEVYWRTLGLAGDPGVLITTLNIEAVEPSTTPNITSVQGDARDLSRFGDGAFEVVFSNSLIEHVGDLGDQRRAAREMRRVGRAYFIQTPNRRFPLEPHFLFPFFQFLPLGARAYLLSQFEIGWSGRIRDRQEARRVVESVQLLDRATFLGLFPGAELWEERALGLVKSFVAYGGFPPEAS
jgi:hypothetical protein